MSLESATYVNQLVVSNPEGADPKGQGDDHLRLIKTTLKNTFPNINAAVNATPTELNSLVGGNAVFKTGMIVLWSGSIASIPAGWNLCNGTAGTPDLTDRFIVGAGLSYAVGSIGGVVTHSHSISVAGTALDISQIPSHSHVVSYGPITPNGSDTAGAPGEPLNPLHYPGNYNFNTSAAGSGAAHAHGASASVADNRPPFYALAYIRKN